MGPTLIAGIDPGFDRTGFAILDTSVSPAKLVDAGVIRTPRDKSLGERLFLLHQDLREVLSGKKILSAAVEKIFFSVNVKTAISVAHGRGVALSLLAELGIPVTEYTPSQIKKAVAGNGKAGKTEIQEMVRRLLSLPKGVAQDDAADAIAAALCHGGPSAYRIINRTR